MHTIRDDLLLIDACYGRRPSGEETRSHQRFVRWEMDVLLDLDLPIKAVNLNGMRGIDFDLYPPLIRDKYVVHIPFKMRIIKYALDNFPNEYHNKGNARNVPRDYPDSRL